MRPTLPVRTSLSVLTRSLKGQGEVHSSRLWRRPDCPGKTERRGQQKGWQGRVEMLQVRGDEGLEQGCGRGDGDGDPDAKRSTRCFIQVLNEDQRVEKNRVSCLRRPLEKLSIYNENTEHSKGPGGERWSNSFTRLLRKRFSVGEDYQQSGERTEKLAFRVTGPYLRTNNSHSYSETQFIFHGVDPSSYSTVIIDLCRSLSPDTPLLKSRNLTHVQLKVISGHNCLVFGFSFCCLHKLWVPRLDAACQSERPRMNWSYFQE